MNTTRMQGVLRQMLEIHKDFTAEEQSVLRSCFEALEFLKRISPTLEKVVEERKNK